MGRFFNNSYPYTDFHEMNLDWVIAKIKEYEDSLAGLKEEILRLTKEYTDQQLDERLATYQQQIDDLVAELTGMYNQLETDVENLQTSVNTSLIQMDRKIADLRRALNDAIVAINARTDLAIEQNNEYLLEHMSEELANIKVNNALTGTIMTLQNMLNYLCTLHMENAIDYTTLASKQKTYTQLAGYNMTYTQLAMQGGSIIQ